MTTIERDYILVEDDATKAIEVDEREIIIIEDVETQLLYIGTAGAQGPKGDKGDKGDAADAAFQYVYNQIAPSTTWVITHNLNGFPNVTVQDSAGSVIEGEITYNNANTLTLQFSASFSGNAYLS